MQQTLEFLDMMFKFEAIFDGLGQIYFWLSVVEVTFFLFNIIFFVMNKGSALWYAILFLLFHMVRATVGLYISNMVPPSHELTRKIGYKGDSQLKFAQVRPELGTQIQNLLLEHLDDIELPSLIYSVSSIICAIFDIVAFFVFVGIAGKMRRKAQGLLNDVVDDQVPADYTLI